MINITFSPAHEDFHWIFGKGREERFADFIELVRDVSAGVRSCLQIVYTSNLVREMNQDAEAGDLGAPAISKTDADNLYRLSLAAIAVLQRASQDKVDALNQQ